MSDPEVRQDVFTIGSSRRRHVARSADRRPRPERGRVERNSPRARDRPLEAANRDGRDAENDPGREYRSKMGLLMSETGRLIAVTAPAYRPPTGGERDSDGDRCRLAVRANDSDGQRRDEFCITLDSGQKYDEISVTLGRGTDSPPRRERRDSARERPGSVHCSRIVSTRMAPRATR